MMSSCAPSPSSDPGDKAAPADHCGALAKHRFEADGLPARDYYVYASCRGGDVPLIVYLHGCNQTATEAFVQTRWKSFADEHGLVVVFPEQFKPDGTDIEDQLTNGNGAQCWNWFNPEHISRDSGEPATIAGITKAVMASHHVDADRVYVAGISAGGVMTSAMGATYPDLFAAIGVIAGCGYPACGDPSGNVAAAAMGDYAHVMPAIVIHGTADEAAVFPMGEDAVHQWLDTDDILDNGAQDGSVPATPASSEDHGLDEGAVSGLGTVGDTCVGDRTASPCPSGVLGFSAYPYTIEHYVDAAGAPLVDFWILHGAMHNYVSGDPSVNWSDPVGPDITAATYDFFMAHPRVRQ